MKKIIALVIITLSGLVGIIFFLYHFGRSDSQALTEFSVAYNNYDQAISELSTADYMSGFEDAPSSDELVLSADDALSQLIIKSSARISSLTRHDAEIMSTIQEIAELSTKEFTALMAYRSAISTKSADQDKFSRELEDLRSRRRAAHARFQELSGF